MSRKEMVKIIKEYKKYGIYITVDSRTIGGLVKNFIPEDISFLNLQDKALFENSKLVLEGISYSSEMVHIDFTFGTMSARISESFSDFADELSTITKDDTCLNEISGFRKYITLAKRRFGYRMFFDSYGMNLMDGLCIPSFSNKSPKDSGNHLEDIQISFCLHNEKEYVIIHNLPENYLSQDKTRNRISFELGGIQLITDLDNPRFKTVNYKKDTKHVALIGPRYLLHMEDYSDMITDIPMKELSNLSSQNENIEKSLDAEDIIFPEENENQAEQPDVSEDYCLDLEKTLQYIPCDADKKAPFIDDEWDF